MLQVECTKGDPLGTHLPDMFVFYKNYIGITVYLLNSLSLGIASDGYVKDIL